MKMMGKFFLAIIAIFALMVASVGAINYGIDNEEYIFVVCGVIDFGTLAYTVYKFIKGRGLKWEN
jgi:ABC-type transport system involved in multi-copper enzyme maturation permease subunit